MDNKKIVSAIIKQQSSIIGEYLAKERATSSGVVKFDSENIEDLTVIENETKVVIEKLVRSYEVLFGMASVEVCLDTLKQFPDNEITPLLSDRLKSIYTK